MLEASVLLKREEEKKSPYCHFLLRLILRVLPNSVRFPTSRLVLLHFVHVFEVDLECSVRLDHVLVQLPKVASILCMFYSWIWGSCAYFIHLSYNLISYLSFIFLCLPPHEIDLFTNCFILNLILMLRLPWNIGAQYPDFDAVHTYFCWGRCFLICDNFNNRLNLFEVSTLNWPYRACFVNWIGSRFLC